MSRPVAVPKGNSRPKRSAGVVSLELVGGRPLPVAPGWMVSEFAVSLWESVWSAGADHYDPVFDRQLIERYVEVLDEIDEIREVLSNETTKAGSTRRKYLAKGSTGQSILHPLRKDLKELRRELLPLEKELGKTPEARARLGMAMDRHRSVMDGVRESVEATFVDVDDV